MKRAALIAIATILAIVSLTGCNSTQPPTLEARVEAVMSAEITADIASINDMRDIDTQVEFTGRCQVSRVVDDNGTSQLVHVTDLPCIRQLPEYAVFIRHITDNEQHTEDAFLAMEKDCEGRDGQLLVNLQYSIKNEQGALVAAYEGNWGPRNDAEAKVDSDLSALDVWAKANSCG